MSDTEHKHVSKDAARRVEIFTGAGRRRQWTDAEKARIVAESEAGGDSVSGVARRHGLTSQQLFGWRREARQRAAAGGSGSAGGTTMPFAAVVVEGTPLHGVAAIEIAVAGAGAGAGFVVRVPAGVDAGALATVLRAVKAAS